MTVLSVIFAVPSMPPLNRLCTVIIWSPPAEPAGVIVRYEVRFPELSNEILRFGPSKNFYITTDTQKNRNARVQVPLPKSSKGYKLQYLLATYIIVTIFCPYRSEL